MNVMLQRHCAKYIYVVPEGLKELMSDISREVIRCQPDNIYTYIADYLDALLITRENARVAARLVQNITDISTTTVEFLLRTGMDRSEADKVVAVIERSFRKKIHVDAADLEEAVDEFEEINVVSDIIDKTDIPPELAEEAAKIIQSAYRRFKERREKERQLLSGMVDWRVAARSAIRLYRKTGVTFEEANRAATLIKAAYKGYYTRRIMRQLAEESRLLAESLDEEEFEEEEISDDHDPKFVKMNYGTIIPHVDFDDPKLAVKDAAKVDGVPSKEKGGGSTTSVTICSAIENILDMTFEDIGGKEGEETTASEEIANLALETEANEENPQDVKLEQDVPQTEDEISPKEETKQVESPQELKESDISSDGTRQQGRGSLPESKDLPEI